VLQQLRSLAAEGLVQRQAVRHGVGRPRHLYDVTDRAQRWLPAAYDRLADAMVAAVRAVGGEGLLEQVFERRRAAQVEAIRARLVERGLHDAPLAARVRELAVIQDEQGYLCEFEDGDGLVVRQHNCAISSIAASAPAACDAEERLFRDVLDADVVRSRHIASGDRCCEYRIAERAADGTAAPRQERAGSDR
jgi:predicted ArsR family transcriptional regulator